tara:strand:+ start:592 stop:783 length:192 start_codon:yes stop_codon:yes gene_type:complete
MPKLYDLEQAFELRKTLSRKDRARELTKLLVLENILRGIYDKEDAPLQTAKDDVDWMNGDKVL